MADHREDFWVRISMVFIFVWGCLGLIRSDFLQKSRRFGKLRQATKLTLAALQNCNATVNCSRISALEPVAPLAGTNRTTLQVLVDRGLEPSAWSGGRALRRDVEICPHEKNVLGLRPKQRLVKPPAQFAVTE